MKREHPTLVMMATFLTAYFFIYQVGPSTATQRLNIYSLCVDG